MLFDYAKVQSGQNVLILGAAGNVASYAVQLAAQAGLKVFATASSEDAEYVRGLGAAVVIDYKAERLEDDAPIVDIVLDTVGGNLRDWSITRLRPGGILVSIVSATSEMPGSSIRSISTMNMRGYARPNKVEQGDAGVALGVYARVMQVLRLESALALLGADDELYPFCRDALKRIPDRDHLGGFLCLTLRHWVNTFGEKLSGVGMPVPRICKRNIWVLSQCHGNGGRGGILYRQII